MRMSGTSNLHWRDDDRWMAIEQPAPTSRPGLEPERNGRVMSGILYVLRVRCRRIDSLRGYGPAATVFPILGASTEPASAGLSILSVFMPQKQHTRPHMRYVGQAQRLR